MQKLLRVSVAIFLAQCVALAAAPVQAADGVVLVGCDLFSEGGPRVAFVQSHGVFDTNDDFQRRRFFGVSGLRSDDFEDRDCAEILSGVIDDGLNFQAMQVFGEDAGLALWFFQED